MNALGDFYKQLATRLLNIKDAEDKSIIKHIDFWNEQYNGDWKEVFNHPAVFLEFKSIPWQSTGRHKQLGQMYFDLHIASSTKAKSSYKGQFTDLFLEHLQLNDLIHYWLTGWNGDFFGSVSRTNFATDHIYGDIIKHVQSFKCTITDKVAMRSFTRVEGDKLVVNLDIE
ncbi:MAG: hypothetical protein QM503_04605 [Bacteroidota bacterium]